LLTWRKILLAMVKSWNALKKPKKSEGEMMTEERVYVQQRTAEGKVCRYQVPFLHN